MGVAMRANQAASVDTKKKTYSKPQLVLHGSVQKLTETATAFAPDCGSNIRIPTFPGHRPGGSKFGGW
jgi:hypothetical protein